MKIGRDGDEPATTVEAKKLWRASKRRLARLSFSEDAYLNSIEAVFFKVSSSSDCCDSEFSPELFGLLDNPGIVRLENVNYPGTIFDADYDDNANRKELNFLRVSFEHLGGNSRGSDHHHQHYDKKVLRVKKDSCGMMSKSLDNIFSPLCMCNLENLMEYTYGL